MTDQNNIVNIDLHSTGGGTAPLHNLGHLLALAQELEQRPEHLPGIGVFSGPSGFGKSTAAAYVSGKIQAHYLEIRSTWTKKVFLENLLQQIGVSAGRTIAQMAAQAAEELACSQKTIILDEFDNAVDRNLIELVRDLYEQSRSPIILIGEERLPQKLQRWERFHGRILSWYQAVPADLSDAQTLANHYVPEVSFEDAVLQKVVSLARGSVRRIVVNLNAMKAFANNEGLDLLTLEDWGKREMISGNPPAARRFV